MTISSHSNWHWMSNFGFNFYLSNRLFLELAREYQLYVRYGGKRHVCRQSSFYASYSTLHAHISVFHLTSAQRIACPDRIFNILCTHLASSSDICAAKPWYTLWVASSMRTCRVWSFSVMRMTRSFLNHRYDIVHEMWPPDSSLPLRMTRWATSEWQGRSWITDTIMYMKCVLQILRYRSEWQKRRSEWQSRATSGWQALPTTKRKGFTLRANPFNWYNCLVGPGHCPSQSMSLQDRVLMSATSLPLLQPEPQQDGR